MKLPISNNGGRLEPVTEEDPGGGMEPGGGRTKVKGSGASFPRSLDQMGPPQEEDHLGGPMETGAVPHLLPAEISV